MVILAQGDESEEGLLAYFAVSRNDSTPSPRFYTAEPSN